MVCILMQLLYVMYIFSTLQWMNIKHVDEISTPPVMFSFNMRRILLLRTVLYKVTIYLYLKFFS